MKTNFLWLILLTLLNTAVFGQSNSWILGPVHTLDIGISPPQSLPTSGALNNNNPLDGYGAEPAQNAQNIVTDVNNQIRFFIVDGAIFDRNGDFIAEMNATPSNIPVTGYKGQTAVVPLPGSCDEYLIISTNRSNDNVNAPVGSRSFFGRFKVKYKSNGQLDPCSGFIPFVDSNGNQSFMKDLADLAGAEYFAGGVVGFTHYEYHKFAVTKNVGGGQYLFVSNHQKIYKFRIVSSGLIYDGFFDFNQQNSTNSTFVGFEPSISGIINYERSEMEVMTVDSNFRLAVPVDASLVSNSIFDGVFVFDVDPLTGLFVPNSNKVIRYTYASPQAPQVELKGVEFSQNGQRLYITHSSITPFSSTFDRFDLTDPNPSSTREVVSTDIIYKDSHIERIANDRIIIPTQSNMKVINNSSLVGLPTLNNLFTLNSYNAVSPFVSGASSSDDFARLLQTQIDDFDYSNYLIEGIQCCLSNKIYDQNVFVATTNGLWTGNQNPLNGNNGIDVYVKGEIRIPAGLTITIQGMNLYFAPGARLVVENSSSPFGQGGRLILDGTTLSVDSECDQNALWLGVEVWGNQTLTQGVWTNSSQGRLEMKNQSRIEHAWVGVLLSKRNVSFAPSDLCQSFPIVQPFGFVNARNGGIVRATGNPTFYNNQRGVQFKPYFGPGGVAGPNNLSYFYDVTFEWNGSLKQSNYQDHARLEEVKGIAFKGCDFVNNTAPSYTSFPDGKGINATESQFYVTPLCNTIVITGQLCPGEISNTFKNLRFGILTSNANLLSFTCDKSVFTNNQYGIHVTSTKGEKITSNDFAIRESDLFQTAGLAMYSSSEYKVENNMFYEFNNSTVTTGTALSYGIVVNNSGAVPNEIYRNYFHDVKIGGQTERINGVQIDANNNPVGALSIKGLTWKCNDFQKDINQHDLTLMSARIHYLQGEPGGGSTLLETKQRVAGNKFSLSNEPFGLAHDIFVSDNSQRFKYSYIDAPRFMPDSYTSQNLVGGTLVNGTIQLEQALWGTPPMLISDSSGTCPSKLVSKISAVIVTLKYELLDEIAGLKLLIDNGNTQELINTTNTASEDDAKNLLLAASPYLSDEVLLTYIAKIPPISNLKQVLLANSNLSIAVKNELLNVSMPNGTRNQIAAAQNGFSERTRLMFEISYLQSNYDELFNEQYRDLLLFEGEDANFNDLIQLLKEEGDEERLKLLFSTYIIVEDEIKANETRDQLLTVCSCDDLNAMSEIELSIINSLSTCMALNADSTIVLELQNLEMNAADEIISKKAACMLRTIDEDFEPEIFLVASSALQLNTQTTTGSDIEGNSKSLMNIYPNPSSGIVTLDFPEMEIGLFEIKVLDINGRQIERFVSEGLSNAELINLESLDKGIYFLEIYLNGQFTESNKLILK